MTTPAVLRAAVALAAAALAVVGCSSEDAQPSAPTTELAATSSTATKTTVDLPSGVRVLHAWRLPADVAPNPNGAHSSSRHAFFGVAIPALTDGGAIDPDARTRYAVLDLTSGDLELRPTTDPGAISDQAVFVTEGEIDHLVRLEIQPRPADECTGDDPDQCWTWQLRAETADDGAGEQLAKAASPGSPFAIPQPITTGGEVVWLEISDPSTALATMRAWRPGGAPRTVASNLPAGRLTADRQSVWITPDDPHRAEAVKVALKGGATTTLTLPKDSQMAVPAGDQIAYVVDRESSSSARLVLAPTTEPARGRTVLTAPSLFQVISAGPGTVVASTDRGYELVGAVSGTLPLDSLTGVQRDQNRLNLLIGPTDAPNTVAVVTLSP